MGYDGTVGIRMVISEMHAIPWQYVTFMVYLNNRSIVNRHNTFSRRNSGLLSKMNINCS